MALTYKSGQLAMVGDRIRYEGLAGEVELVIDEESDDSGNEWFLKECGPGLMIVEPTTFGRVYVSTDAGWEDLEFVERADE